MHLNQSELLKVADISNTFQELYFDGSRATLHFLSSNETIVIWHKRSVIGEQIVIIPIFEL